MKICPECGERTESGTCPKDGCPTVAESTMDATVLLDQETLMAERTRSGQDTFPVGYLVNGKYRIVRVIGKGGMGTVYLAFQREMDRTVALKVADTRAGDPVGVKRFLREIKVVAGLKHAHTVRVFDSGQLEDGRPFFTMEYLESRPLSAAIRAGEEFDDRRIVRIARQVCMSLGEAHAAGIIHRDLSPDNIFLVDQFGQQDFVKVLDFGVAKGYTQEGDKSENLTVEGVFVGKPAYASPEQAAGEQRLDGRSDLYSLGVVMYRLVTGQVPFHSSTPMRVLMAHINEPPKPVQEAAGRPVRWELADLIERLMAKRREDRPASAAQVLEELDAIERAMEEEALTPSPDISEDFLPTVAVTTGSKLPTARRRRRFWLGVLVAIVALGGMGIVAGLMFRGGAWKRWGRTAAGGPNEAALVHVVRDVPDPGMAQADAGARGVSGRDPGPQATADTGQERDTASRAAAQVAPGAAGDTGKAAAGHTRATGVRRRRTRHRARPHRKVHRKRIERAPKKPKSEWSF